MKQKHVSLGSYLSPNDFKRVVQHVQCGKGVMTPLAVASLWGIDQSLAASLIAKYYQR